MATNAQLKKIIELVNAWYGVREPELNRRRPGEKINEMKNRYFAYVEEQMKDKQAKVDIVAKYSKFLQRILIELSDDFIRQRHQSYMINKPKETHA